MFEKEEDSTNLRTWDTRYSLISSPRKNRTKWVQNKDKEEKVETSKSETSPNQSIWIWIVR